MEHLFRIALCMSLLMGYLQAPVSSEDCEQKKCLEFNIQNRTFQRLSEVTCGDDVTFISPTKVQSCEIAALEVFIAGLDKAEKNCTGGTHRAGQMISSFRNVYPNNTNCPRPARCNWESKAFPEFVEDMKRFVQLMNSQC